MQRINQVLIVSVLAAGALALAPASAGATATAAPSSQAFGNQDVGVASAGRTTTITVSCSYYDAFGCLFEGNFERAPVFGGANPGDFTQTNTCADLTVGNAITATCEFTITFRPTAPGTRTATLTTGNETSSAPATPITIALSGKGTTPTSGKKCKKAKKHSASAANKKCKKKKEKK